VKHTTDKSHTYLNTIRITLDDILLNHLLAAIIRMEDKCENRTMTPDEYWAAVALANDCNAPDFIVDYFKTKAGKL